MTRLISVCIVLFEVLLLALGVVALCYPFTLLPHPSNGPRTPEQLEAFKEHVVLLPAGVILIALAIQRYFRSHE